MSQETHTVADDLKRLLDELGEWEQPAKMFYNEKNYKGAMRKVLSNLVAGKQTIVYGDFDFDGLGSAAVLFGYLEHLYKIVHGEEKGESLIDFIISDPEEGFGLTKKDFTKFMDDGYSLVITVDNGSDSEVVRDGLEGLLVLDHHPSKNVQPYILNPNTGRTDGLSHGTSGGKVVFDFITNIDKTIVKTNLFPEYVEKYRNNDFMMKLKGIAAQTLVSDMATWDKHNRKFFKSVKDAGVFDPKKLPYYARLKGDTSAFAFSFNLISLGNCGSRMKGVYEPRGMSKIKKYDSFNLNLVVDWIFPKDLDHWVLVDNVLEEMNEKKKALVRQFYSDYSIKNKGQEEQGFGFYFNADMPHRLSGLIANKISIPNNAMPTVCGTIKANGDISISGRGDNVKKLIAFIFDDNAIIDKTKYNPESMFGGHPSACGGTIKIPPGKTYDEMIALVVAKIEEYSKKYDLLSLKRKTEIISSRPVSVSEYKELLEIYKEKSGGADYKKKLCVPVADYGYDGISEFASKWQSIGIRDKLTGEGVDFLIDGSGFDTKSRVFGAKDRVLLMELTTNGKASMFSVFDNVEQYLKNVEIVEELRDTIHLDTEYKLVNNEPVKEVYVEAKVDVDVLAEIKAEMFWQKLKQRDVQAVVPVKEEIVPITPTVMSMITVETVEKHSDTIFVFGDNLLKRGLGGQAVIRHYENSFGIPTKRLPSMADNAFFGSPENLQEETKAITESLSLLHKEYYLKGKKIVFPQDGLGTGRARLIEKMPEFYLFINMMIVERFGCLEYKKFIEEAKIAVSEKVKRNNLSDALQTAKPNNLGTSSNPNSRGKA